MADVQVTGRLGREARHHCAVLRPFQVHKLALLLPSARLSLAASTVASRHCSQGTLHAVRSGNGLHKARHMREHCSIKCKVCVATES